MTDTATSNNGSLIRIVTTLLVAGALATVAFDFFGQTLSPLLKSIASPWLGAKLAPVPLAQTVMVKLSGFEGDAAKEFAREIRGLGLPHGLHTLTGLLAYPIGYALIARPVSRLSPFAPWWLVGLAYGAVLWVFALYIMAHLVGGMPAFLGFSGITWVALWGHMLFGLVVALVWYLRHERG